MGNAAKGGMEIYTPVHISGHVLRFLHVRWHGGYDLMFLMVYGVNRTSGNDAERCGEHLEFEYRKHGDLIIFGCMMFDFINFLDEELIVF